MVGGAFAATAVEVVKRHEFMSWAAEREAQKRDLAAMLAIMPLHRSILVDLEIAATEWWIAQPALGYRVMAGGTTHYYCTDCGVPEGTEVVDHIKDRDDLSDEGRYHICETCGEPLDKEVR